MIRGGILVGGASRRMGRPKAEIVFGGRRLDEIAEAALSPHCERVHRLGPGGIADAVGHAGPIAGIIAARAVAPNAWWVIAACDMPLLRPEAVAWLLSARGDGAVVVIPRDEAGQPEPTLALYGPGSDPLLAAVRAPVQLVGKDGVVTPTIPAELAPCWTNVNRPEELDVLSRDPGGRE